MKPRLKMCLHHIYEDRDCERCDQLIASGKVKERPLYSQQRVWQLEQKAAKRCEICGRKKRNCESTARCQTCLEQDRKRARKRKNIYAEWRPGMKGRRMVRGGAKTLGMMAAADARNAELNDPELAALNRAFRKVFRSKPRKAKSKGE